MAGHSRTLILAAVAVAAQVVVALPATAQTHDLRFDVDSIAARLRLPTPAGNVGDEYSGVFSARINTLGRFDRLELDDVRSVLLRTAILGLQGQPAGEPAQRDGVPVPSYLMLTVRAVVAKGDSGLVWVITMRSAGSVNNPWLSIPGVRASSDSTPVPPPAPARPPDASTPSIYTDSTRAFTRSGTDATRPPDADEFVLAETEPKWEQNDLVRRIHYPEYTRRLNVQGMILVRLLVDKHGRAIRAVVDRSEHVILEAAAVDAVRTMPFTPAMSNGVPIDIWVQIPIMFNLH